MNVTLTQITNDPVLAIEEAASTCYNSTPSGDGKILKHCIKSGHTSVTEFAVFTFTIEGVSRSLLAQLTRHRHAGYAVRSQRYCDEKDFGYVTPSTIAHNASAKIAYNKLMDKIGDTYEYLQELGIPNEDARFVLPNSCDTKLSVIMNLRALMHFMNERLCTCAQWEIRKLARIMRDLIIEQVPALSPYLVPKCEKYGAEFGFCTESTERNSKCKRHPLLKTIFEIYNRHKGECSV